MKEKILLASCLLYAVSPVQAQMMDYTGAAAGAAGLGTGLGAGASKMLAQPTGKAMLSPLQRKAAEEATARALKQAAVKTQAGAHTDAAAILTQAAKNRQVSFGVGDTEAGRLYMQAAKSYTLGKDHEGAENAYRAALVNCSKDKGPGSAQAIPILSGLGSALDAQNRSGEAITIYKQALMLQERNSSANSADADKIRMSLIDVSMKAADYVTADPLLKLSVSRMEAQGVSDKPAYLNLLTQQEKELRATFHFDEADKVGAKISALSGTSEPVKPGTDSSVSVPSETPGSSSTTPQQAK